MLGYRAKILGALVLVLLTACGAELTAPAPDAPALPSCAAVGCPDHAFCHTDGTCTCPQPDGAPPLACRAGEP